MEHLPECGTIACNCTDQEECGPQCRHYCICDQLRAYGDKVKSERISEWDRGSGSYYRALEDTRANLDATRGLCATTDPNRFGLALAIATVEAMINEFTGVMLDG